MVERERNGRDSGERWHGVEKWLSGRGRERMRGKGERGGGRERECEVRERESESRARGSRVRRLT